MPHQLFSLVRALGPDAHLAVALFERSGVGMFGLGLFQADFGRILLNL
ncbi:MAG: hypothetical protein K0M47_17845 [Rhizobium sp.]|nr:hypothetical protein [Rhizobium sp.]